MIWASIKMSSQDMRLLLPSVLTVFTNFFFASVLLIQGRQRMGGSTSGMMHQAGSLLTQGGLNGSMDPSGFGSFGNLLTGDTMMLATCIFALWWLTNRFLEGVTTALVYSHLTEGAGTGRFSVACQAVFSSLPAIVTLGVVTFFAKKLAGWMRDRRGGGIFGFGVNFLSQVVEVFWTLAGHLILPAIVIEGTSFWGALKRADRIAQGNLLTIGVGEVGVDAICKAVSFLVYLIGVGCFGGFMYLRSQNIQVALPLIGMMALSWACMVVVVTAASIYIRAAFYTCLYVWAIESEAVEEAHRHRVSAPAPLAAALA
jgi:hypothetical protein